MDELLQTLAMRPEPWTGGEVFLNTTLAFLMGLFVSWVYRATHRQLTVSFSFQNTLVILSMLMSLVMMVIGSNIARAFGLAGAMSIIRFRTVVKDTRDTAYVFYALAVGMACGTGNLMIATFGGLLVGLFVGILHWTRHGSSGHSEFLLTFQQLPSDHEEQRRIYLPVFEQYFRSYDLVNVKSRKMGDVIKLSFMVTLKNPSDVDQIVGDLSGLEGLMKVNLHWGEKAEN